MKLTNVMQSCLEYAIINKYDIILLQESWVREKKIILHSNFICIILKVLNYRARVAIFVTKTNRKLVCTFKVNIINDSDCQIIHILINDIKNLKIVNVYNEKSLNEHKIWIINRISSKLDFKNDKVIICGDFNAHHN